MTKPKALMFVAPFGFGPAAKAQTILHEMSGEFDFAVVSTGSALEFLTKHRKPNVRYLAGRASQIQQARAIRSFAVAISVNNVPAVRHLKSLGLGERTILVDSLHDWCRSIGQELPPSGLHAILVEDSLPGLVGTSGLGENVTPIATILYDKPTGAKTTATLFYDEIIHLGGVLSPALNRDFASSKLDAWVLSLVEKATSRGAKVAVMGKVPALSVGASDQVDLFDQAAPDLVSALVKHAGRATTTPGIGFVEMAFRARKPVILLPPMNSSQLHHYQSLTEHGITGVLSRAALSEIRKATQGAPWMAHAQILVQWLAENTSAILEGWSRCVDELSGVGAERQIGLQSTLLAHLETQDGIAVLQSLCRDLS